MPQSLNHIDPYAPCPCRSGKKYKWCCLPLHQKAIRASNHPAPISVDDLDDLSNSVLDLIDQGRLDEAEQACGVLAERYPDEIDAIMRLARVEATRGHHSTASALFNKAAAWAMAMPGFEKDSVQDYREKADEEEQAARASAQD